MEFKEDFINPNGRDLHYVKAIILHYMGDSGATAEQEVAYLKTVGLSYHFIVDIDGTIYATQPLSKRAIHCGGNIYRHSASVFFGERYCPSYEHTEEHKHISSPNNVTIAVGFCHPDDTGEPTYATRRSLEKLCAYLCELYNLKPIEGIWRHFDITGKLCPLYFAEHEEEFVDLLHKVRSLL